MRARGEATSGIGRGRVARKLARLLPGLIGLAIGCSPLGSDSSDCGSEPPRATDARATSVVIREEAAPCRYTSESARGSQGHLLAEFDCPGISGPFLVAVKVDGKPVVLTEATCAGFGSQVFIEAGPWEASDDAWHRVELVVDPMNLFDEVDESNNHFVGQVRTMAPDIGVNDGLSRFLLQSSGAEVSTVPAGTPMLVVMGASIKGRYQQVELSARSGSAMSFVDTVTIDNCSSVYAASPRYWEWTPLEAGSYPVEFRVAPLSGELDRDANNNVMVKTLEVTPVTASGAAGRRARAFDLSNHAADAR